ncbi:MAG: PfkB family carbohydrate kinase [Candidatus Micrarchaeota archaeon]
MAVLTIAGSSPDGGAGVQMDLKVFDAIGVTGASVITAVTSQNTKETKGFWWVPPEAVSSQLAVVFSDMDIKAVKIGMVGNPETAKVVYEFLKGKKVPIVLDPVMSAQSDGGSLFEKGALPVLKKLASISEVIVPNAEECEALTGVHVETIADAEEAADKFLSIGAKSVLVTGIKSGVISDLFKSDFKFTYTKQLKMGGTKGGGCTLSSAIAAFISLGISVPSAVEYAEGFVDASIAHKKRIGRGIESLDPLSNLRKDAERYTILCNLKAALSMLESHNEFAPFIPQIGTNLAYAIRDAKNPHEVAAVVGRVRDAIGVPRSLGTVEFGASSHMARVVLSAMAVDPEIRSAINIASLPNLEAASRKAGYTTSHFDRKREPKSGKDKGATMEWGIRHSVKKGKVADIVFDSGGQGKEPCAFVFGRDAIGAVTNALKIIATSYRSTK